VKRRLKKEATAPIKKGDRASVLRKVSASNTLSRIESGQFVSKLWKAPWGEPEWVTIPGGEFWMGSEKGYDNEGPVHRVFVAEFRIARVPITNAQYALFVADVGAGPAPAHWRGHQPPPGQENHPVVNVSWYDARKYCEWLSEKVRRAVRLPTEAEWEKAARGDIDRREYPWGDEWSELHCNSNELGVGETSPVGLFLNGTSPYGCLDMVGNILEWCQSKSAKYPYKANNDREDLGGNDPRVLRGGSFNFYRTSARCSFHDGYRPDGRYEYFGFRVVVSCAPVETGKE
jgi:formylglycine-generating enzyme required for sulfatase activity